MLEGGKGFWAEVGGALGAWGGLTRRRVGKIGVGGESNAGREGGELINAREGVWLVRLQG